jgi:hypothetical protein
MDMRINYFAKSNQSLDEQVCTYRNQIAEQCEKSQVLQLESNNLRSHLKLATDTSIMMYKPVRCAAAQITRFCLTSAPAQPGTGSANLNATHPIDHALTCRARTVTSAACRWCNAPMAADHTLTCRARSP